MGQIVGGAAKPKRCNLNKLSQLGTPAAGEYILVSSDNSMNAAGQGNFDCYIEGDGQKAATALELKKIDEEAELLNGDTVKNITWTNGFVNASGTITVASTLQFSQPIMLRAGESVKVGTTRASISFISYTEASSAAVGDVVVPLRKSSSTAQYEEYTYTAVRDMYVVLSVLKSGYSVEFNTGNGITQRVTDNESGIVRINSGLIDISGYEYNQGTILATRWYIATGYNFKVIPVDFTQIKVDNTRASSVNIGLLKTYTPPKNNDVPDFCENGFYILAPGVHVIDVPNDANFMVIAGNTENVILQTTYSIQDLAASLPYIRALQNSEYSVSFAVTSGTQKTQDINESFKAGDILRLSLTGTDGIIKQQNYSFFLDVTNSIYFPVAQYNSSIVVRLSADTSKIRCIIAAAAALQSGEVSFTIEKLGVIERVDIDEENIASLQEDVSELQNEVDSELILPSYYHTNNYIENKVSRINTLAKANANGFIFITDVHWSQNAKKSPAIIKYLSKNTFLDRIVCGGDTANGGSAEFCHLVSRAWVDRKAHYVVGNHEYDNNATDAEIYYIFDSLNNDEIGDPMKHWYYTDDVQSKTRYIILNAEGTNSFSTEQLTWFTDVALNVDSGWKMLIFAHHFAGLNWETDEMYPATNAFATAINNYAGNGEIIAVFQGHWHRDRYTYLPSGVPVIFTTCDKYVASAYNSTQDIDVTREKDTITEQAMDVVVIDYTAKEIHMVRIGGLAHDGQDSNVGNEVEERVIAYGV